jgi:hypothetical protein
MHGLADGGWRMADGGDSVYGCGPVERGWLRRWGGLVLVLVLVLVLELVERGEMNEKMFSAFRAK